MQENKKANWRDLLISLMILVIGLIAVLQLKISVPHAFFQGNAVVFSGSPFLLGIIAGLLFSVLFCVFKKPAAIAIVAAVTLGLWLVISGDITLSPALFGCGSICCIAFSPFLAQWIVGMDKR